MSTLAQRIADMEDRVLNAATIEAAARFHKQLDRLRAQQDVPDAGSDYRRGYQAGYKAGRVASSPAPDEGVWAALEEIAAYSDEPASRNIARAALARADTTSAEGKGVERVTFPARYARNPLREMNVQRQVRAATRPAEEGQ